jgi:lipopolysaccharide/colanic/teichoic acid biosynthesis glycosyltransferase
MVSDAPALGPQVTVGHDARITLVGRVLRHYRIDELPQLLDVLRGRMSLVGPRPEVPRFVAHYPAALRARVLAVRPGITDPASLANIDEAALLAAAADPEREYIERILPAKLALQVAYAERATLRSDLAVLARTLRVLLSR